LELRWSICWLFVVKLSLEHVQIRAKVGWELHLVLEIFRGIFVEESKPCTEAMWSRVFLLPWVVGYGVLVWCQLSTAAPQASSNNVSSTLFPPMGNRLFLVPTHLIKIASFASVLQQI
jgi:hypothetical protein